MNLKKKKPQSKHPKSFEERLDDLPMTPKSKIRATLGEPYPVHSLRYPFPKQEKWFVYLVEHVKKSCDRCNNAPAVIFCQNCNGAFCPNCDKSLHFKAEKKVEEEHRRVNIPPARIVGFQKLANYVDYEKIEMRFRPPVRASYKYKIFARCDSYRECDLEATFELDVLQPKPVDEKKKEEEEGLVDDPEDEEEKPSEPKWYYMYCTSFWEMMGNIIVFIILMFVFVNFLQQRGYWQKYVQPSLNRAHGLWIPIWKKVHPVISPVYDPVTKYTGMAYTYVSDYLYRPVNVSKFRSSDEEQWDL